jgi:hypothetical protein
VSSVAVDSPVGERRPRRSGPWVAALLFTLPYLLLMVAWAGSNPPGAAPDEPDHLVKALGMASLDIGTPYTGPPYADSDAARRNASISRVVAIPTRLSPAGYTCEAQRPDLTAACLPQDPPGGIGTLDVVTPLGSYPPFLYVPIGLAAQLASTPYQAFLAARAVCVAMAGVLLLLGSQHLVRWLGRRALLGAFVVLTPMVVFTSGMAGLSGVEITAAFAVAAVTVAALRRPESLREPGSQLLLGGVGAALVLSRQLGAVTFAAMALLLVVRLGWRYFWDLLRRPRPAVVTTLVLLVGSGLAVVWWERTYDHPVLTASPWDAGAVGGFSASSYSVLQSAVGNFGWLDTLLPRWCYLVYFLLLITLVGSALLLGSAADRRTLAVGLLATLALAYITYASVFYPVQAGLQGRHVLPFFLVLPVLAGVVLAERLDRVDTAAFRRFVTLVAVAVPVLQAVGLYENARRYAVGLDGPIAFLGRAEWSPGLGWVPWLVLGVVGALALAGAVLVTGSAPTRTEREETVDVGR